MGFGGTSKNCSGKHVKLVVQTTSVLGKQSVASINESMGVGVSSMKLCGRSIMIGPFFQSPIIMHIVFMIGKFWRLVN